MLINRFIHASAFKSRSFHSTPLLQAWSRPKIDREVFDSKIYTSKIFELCKSISEKEMREFCENPKFSQKLYTGGLIVKLLRENNSEVLKIEESVKQHSNILPVIKNKKSLEWEIKDSLELDKVSTFIFSEMKHKNLSAELCLFCVHAGEAQLLSGQLVSLLESKGLVPFITEQKAMAKREAAMAEQEAARISETRNKGHYYHELKKIYGDKLQNLKESNLTLSQLVKNPEDEMVALYDFKMEHNENDIEYGYINDITYGGFVHYIDYAGYYVKTERQYAGHSLKMLPR